MMKGQTLIEILASFGVATILVTAITIAVISALSNATFSKNQNLATQYAQQGMEMLRQMRNSDIAAFRNLSSGEYCLDKDTTTLRSKGTGCGTNVDNIFVREVAIEKNSSSCSNVTKVTISTMWSDSKCTSSGNRFCHNVRLVSCLSEFGIAPTP